MNNSEFVNQLAMEFEEYCRAGNLHAATDRSQLMRSLFDAIASSPDSTGKDGADLIGISSPNAVVEVVDSNTGMLFRRYLELEYSENDNGIRLIGEDLGGNGTSIVFLSAAALEKLRDLRGAGRDNPRCKEE